MVAVALSGPWLLGCQAEPGDVTGPEITSLQALVTTLQAAGATVVQAEVLPRSSNPFFSVESTRLVVNGQNVHVWEYGSSAEADREARLVSPDGSTIGATSVTWIGPPHFYRAPRLIVLYVGEGRDLMTLLGSILGPQFAGR